MRKEFCTKDRVYISYTDEDVCFEELDTADAILIRNDGVIILNNFGKEKTNFYLNYFRKIYSAIQVRRNSDAVWGD